MTQTLEKTTSFTGLSGSNYVYHVYPIDQAFREIPGNYCFARLEADDSFTPLYFGESEDLSKRFKDHHKEIQVLLHRCSHLLAHASSEDVHDRRAEERDLIDAYAPVCNG